MGCHQWVRSWGNRRKHCNTLQHTATHCNKIATRCNQVQQGCCKLLAVWVDCLTKSCTIHCITLHHTATHCNTLQHAATHYNTLQHNATRVALFVGRIDDQLGNRGATHSNTLQHTATHCNTQQHTATHSNTQQHTATHCSACCNTLQHMLQHTARRMSPVVGRVGEQFEKQRRKSQVILRVLAR